MFKTLKRLVGTVAPGAYVALRRLRRSGRTVDRLNRRVGELAMWTVTGGPFAGMRYVREACGSALAPKLLGAYELEIQPWVHQAIRTRPPLVIDVGAAEGYYAVGLARAMASAHVLAYDIDPVARHLCRAMARMNAVEDRVQVEAACTCEVLRSLDLRGALLIVDCEGYETELLDPVKVPGLAAVTILVELHDCYVRGVTDLVLSRFRATHTAEIVHAQIRDARAFTMPPQLSGPERVLAVDEERRAGLDRLPQRWALLVPASRSQEPAR